jgi:5-methylcytosine-specific restriction endonuclease McrA
MERTKRLNGDTPSIVDGKKACTKCQRLLPTASFCRRTLPTGNVSYRSRCKACEKDGAKTEAGRIRTAKIARTYRRNNPKKIHAIKAKYYASEKGKAAKRREDEAYRRSGGRAKVEAKRLALPLTDARAAAKLKNQAQRRAGKVTDELSLFVLSEAYKLAKERKRTTGIDWEVDHIKPVACGGTNTYSNLQVVPWIWNRQKSHLRTEKFFGAC